MANILIPLILCQRKRLGIKRLYFSERSCDDSSVVYYDGGSPDILY